MSKCKITLQDFYVQSRSVRNLTGGTGGHRSPAFLEGNIEIPSASCRSGPHHF